jgi:hypothetical protein
MPSNNASVDLKRVRRELIESFCRLPGECDVVAWQRRLSRAIQDAELGLPSSASDELRVHCHLLRVIGDMLVHSLLPSHTIRALQRSPSPRPPWLSAQGLDFEFVLDRAEALYSLGFVPIIADLTTLISIGDIVGWRGEMVIVLECKNTPSPGRVSTSGRLARQRARGERLEEYLSASYLKEPSGIARMAIPAKLPEPDWKRVEQMLRSSVLSTIGIEILALGNSDNLIACSRRLFSLDALHALMPSAASLRLPAMADYTELFDQASHRNRAPSSYPIAADLRADLLEREILLLRLTDMARLDGNLIDDGVEISLTTHRIHGSLEVNVSSSSGEEFSFTPELVEYCLWTPVPVAAMATVLAGCALNVVRSAWQGEDLPLAQGDQIRYATLYRDDP